MLRVELIRSLDDLLLLEKGWTALWRRCPEATPFQAPQWLIPWWRAFGRGARLWTLSVAEGERLVGLLPLQLVGDPPCLHLLGWGISDYLDVLVEPRLRWPVLGEAFDFLLGHREGWQAVQLDDLPAGSSLLSTALPPGLAVAVRAAAFCPVIALPSSTEAYLAGLSRQQRHHVRQTRRRVEQSFRLSLHRAGEAELGACLEELFRLHGRRWQERDQAGVLQAEAIREFHRQAGPGLLAAGLLDLYSLRFDDATAAAIYVLNGHGRSYGYISGFEPGLEKYSPGLLVLDAAIGDSIGRGMREFDFLRGEEPYKYLWGARNRINYAISLRPS